MPNTHLAGGHCERFALYSAVLSNPLVRGCPGAGLLPGRQRVWLVVLVQVAPCTVHAGLADLADSHRHRNGFHRVGLDREPGSCVGTIDFPGSGVLPLARCANHSHESGRHVAHGAPTH